MKLHIAWDRTIYGQHVETDTLCGRWLKQAIGRSLWGLVGHNRKDKCEVCARVWRALNRR